MDLNFTFKIQKIDRVECFALAARPGDLCTASDAADQSPLGGPHFSPNQTTDADMGRAPDLANK